MTDSRRSTGQKVFATAVLVGLVGLLAGVGTWSALSDTTENSPNVFEAGTVEISDNDSGSAMFTLTNMAPGTATSRCIVVTTTGSLPTTVRLWGATTGTGLEDYLDLKVERGEIATPTFPSCTGFAPDATDYNGDGAGVIFDNSLSAWPTSYSAGIVDPTAGSPATWTTGSTHAYRFTAELQDDNDAQGLNATQTFTWEARSQ